MSDESLSFAKRGIRPINKFIVLSMLSITLLMLDSRFSAVQMAKRYVATALFPLQWLANKPIEWYEYGSALLQSQNYLLRENERLIKENTELKLHVGQAQAQAQDLADLKSLFKLQEHGLISTTAAEIISNGKEPIGSRLIINKGSNDNIQAGDAVVDDTGLIGQISHVHPLSAEITPLTDGNTVIPVTVSRTGIRTLLYGASGSVALRYFPTDADLQPNDILITSGLDSVYPAGIPVARVTETSRNAGTPYYRVKLEPIAALHRSKYVLVLPQTNNNSPTSTPAAS